MNQDRLAIQMELRETIKEALYYHKRLSHSYSEGQYDYNFNCCMWHKQEARRLLRDLLAFKVNS
jgi:hypothetical protein